MSGNAVVRGNAGGASDNTAQGIRTGPGDDSISVLGNATVTGATRSIYAGNGDDTVIIQTSTHINGLINGWNDTDTLTFTGQASQSEVDTATAFATTCNAASNCAGTLTFLGKAYTFQNFEQLILLLQALLPNANIDFGTSGVEPPKAGPVEACTGAAKIFRLDNGDLDVYSGFDALPPNGFLVGRVGIVDLASGILRYQDPGIAAQQGWVVEVTRTDKLIIQVFDGQGNPIGACSL